jgi:hypothetical protein
MRKVAFAVLAAVIMTAPAMAELSHSGNRAGPIFAAEKSPMTEQGERMDQVIIYDSLYPGTAGFWAAPAAPGPLGYDDYVTDTTISGLSLNHGLDITRAKFVGGVTSATGLLGSAAVMWFEFYDLSTAGFITSFGVALPSAGNWIWTINMGYPGFVIPHSALYQIVANTTFTGGGAYSTTIGGQWFFSSPDAVLTGSNSTTIGPAITTTLGATIPMVQDFYFSIPEPATLGLFGAGMLLLLRRRR